MTNVDQARPTTAKKGFDADSMREKYRRERPRQCPTAAVPCSFSTY
jgi:hypothetical protein